MCGIAGFCYLPEKWENNINRMNRCMRNRGPDSSGIWSNESKRVVLGHTRLAIIDLTDNGAQPMKSNSNRYVMVMNGEIYNYKELKAALGSVRLRGTSDTEVLLEFIDKYGMEKALKEVIGMFAFAVYDREKENLYLVRDRMGEKPLYYSEIDRGFIFASTLSAIISHERFQGRLNTKTLNYLFTHKYIPAPYTILQGVHKLLPGMVLKYNLNNRQVVTEPYWELKSVVRQNKIFHRLSYGDAVERLNKLIADSVKKQMEADVPLGTFLSGGIDSTLIAAVMQNLSDRNIKTFSIGFSENGFDEAKYARKTAEYLGTEHTELYVSENDLIDVIPELPNICDEPMADTSIISTYLVSKLAKEMVTVALSGDAGDELFCGYDSYERLYGLWQFSKKVPKFCKKISEIIFPENLMNEKVCRGRILMTAKGMTELYQELYYRSPLVNHFVFNKARLHTRGTEYMGHEIFGTVKDLMLTDVLDYMPNDILAKVDSAAMYCSLETRIPLLDKRIVEFAFNLPEEYMKQGNVRKRILKEVLYKYLPKELVDRPKHGFEVPVHNWLYKGWLSDWAEGLLSYGKKYCDGYLNFSYIMKGWEDYRKKKIWVENLWYVLVFLQWHQKHKNSLNL